MSVCMYVLQEKTIYIVADQLQQSYIHCYTTIKTISYLHCCTTRTESEYFTCLNPGQRRVIPLVINNNGTVIREGGLKGINYRQG
jgi:hypothetical protein